MDHKDSELSLFYRIGVKKYSTKLEYLTGVEGADRRIVEEMIDRMFVAIKELGFYD